MTRMMTTKMNSTASSAAEILMSKTCEKSRCSTNALITGMIFRCEEPKLVVEEDETFE